LPLWDIAARRALAVLKGHAAMVHAVAFSPDGRFVDRERGPDREAVGEILVRAIEEREVASND